MFEDRWCLWEPPPLLLQRWVLFEYSRFDQFPNTLCRAQINILSLIQTESYIVVENLNQISGDGRQTAK